MSFDFLILLTMTRKLALLAQDESIDDTLYELDRFLQKGFFPIELYGLLNNMPCGPRISLHCTL